MLWSAFPLKNSGAFVFRSIVCLISSYFSNILVLSYLVKSAVLLLLMHVYDWSDAAKVQTFIQGNVQGKP